MRGRAERKSQRGGGLRWGACGWDVEQRPEQAPETKREPWLQGRAGPPKEHRLRARSSQCASAAASPARHACMRRMRTFVLSCLREQLYSQSGLLNTGMLDCEVQSVARLVEPTLMALSLALSCGCPSEPSCGAVVGTGADGGGRTAGGGGPGLDVLPMGKLWGTVGARAAWGAVAWVGSKEAEAMDLGLLGASALTTAASCTSRL